MIRKFRKRPVVIEAVQWNGDNLEEIKEFAPGVILVNGKSSLEVATMAGTVILHVGHWLIKGVEGEFYPCDPYIFAITYIEETD